MAEKWRKRGALPFGKAQAAPKITGTLKKIRSLPGQWDMLPLGEKISRIKGLLREVKNPRASRFKFLPSAPEKSVRAVAAKLEERLRAEKENLEDMKRVFSEWGVSLENAGVSAEQVSYPHGTSWETDPEHGIMLFTSPTMARWYREKISGKGLQPSRDPPGKPIERMVQKKKAFGIGRLYGHAFRTGEISYIQPLRFYRKSGKRLMEGTPHGEEGTGRGAPLSNPDILMLYAHLKEAGRKGYEKVGVMERLTIQPYGRIYERLYKLSRERMPVEDFKGLSRSEIVRQMFSERRDEPRYVVFRRVKAQ
jgi:hypothetical protein